MAKSKRQATYDDLLKLPDNVIGEIVNGELYATPRPASPHALASSAIGGQLWGPFHGNSGQGPGPGGWWIVDEPELRFGNDVVVPDVAGWRRERMPRMPNGPAFELPPDWICEVVSPSTERLDRARKIWVYARTKVSHLWLVNPIARTLEAYRLDTNVWSVIATHAGDERVQVAPFEAVTLDLAQWWLGPESSPPVE
jgi:Uma2 family endonuclease